MNHCYRLVRNKATGLWIAAPEIARSCAGQSGGGLKAAALAQVVLLLAALGGTKSAVWAQTASPAGSTATTVFVAPNGATVVNIANPNGAGVSHNQYNQFNVDTKGLVLNNLEKSQGSGVSGLAGALNANPGLGRPATVILNEVVSNNRSILNGFTEVFGGKADVVVANAYGVTCVGCGFVNTDRVTLTTGTPSFDAVGGLKGFDIRSGDVNVAGLGFSGTPQQLLEIVTRRVSIAGVVNAGEVSVVTGANVWNYGTHAVDGQVMAAPAVSEPYAIDTALLGGIYANRIRLIGTEAGVGVRMLGEAAASAGDFSIDTQGAVVLRGNLSATGSLSVASADAGAAAIDIKDASLTAGGKLALNAAGGVQLTGGDLVATGGDLLLAAGSLADSAGQGSVANRRFAAGAMTLVVQGDASVNGNVWQAGGDLRGTLGAWQTGALGATLGGGNVFLTSRIGDLNLAQALVVGAESVRLESAGALRIQGGAQQMILARTGSVLLSARQDIENDGDVKTLVGDITVQTDAALTNAGNLISAGRMNVSAAQRFANMPAGWLQANAGTTIQAGAVDNAGTLVMSVNAGAEADRIVAGGALHNSGRISSAGALLEEAGGELHNAGRLLVQASLDARSQGWTNTSAGTVSVGGDLLIDAGGGKLVNEADAYVGAARMTLRTRSDVENAGTLESAMGDAVRNALAISADGTVVNRGTVNAGGHLQVSGLSGEMAARLTNQGLMTTGATLTVRAADLQNTADGIMQGSSGSDLRGTTLSNDGRLFLSTVQGGDTDRIDIRGALVNKGRIQSQKGSMVVAGSFDNSGQILSAGSLGIATQTSVINRATGILFGSASLTVEAGTDILNERDPAAERGDGQGTMAGGRVNLLAGNGTLTNAGVIQAETEGGSIDVKTFRNEAYGVVTLSRQAGIDGGIRSDSFSNAGEIVSQGGATITAGTQFVNQAEGSIQVQTDLHLRTPADLGLGGRIRAGGTLDVKSVSGTVLDRLLVAEGAVIAAATLNELGSLQIDKDAFLGLTGRGALLKVAGQLGLAERAVLSMAGGVARVDTGSVSNAGQVTGSEKLALTAAGNIVNRAGGIIQAAVGLSVTAGGDIRNETESAEARSAIVADRLDLQALSGSIINQGLVQAGAQGAHLAANTVDNAADALIVLSGTPGVDGQISAATFGNAGYVQSQGGAVLAASAVFDNLGKILVGGDLRLRTPAELSLGGVIRAGGTLDARQQADDSALDRLRLADGATLVARQLGGTLGALNLGKAAVAALTGENARLGVTGDLSMAEGAALSLSGQGNAAISAGSIDNAGHIAAGDSASGATANLTIDVAASLVNRSTGVISANGSLAATAGGNLRNEAATSSVSDAATGQTSTYVQRGAIVAEQTLNLAAKNGEFANAGYLQANGQGGNIDALSFVNSADGIVKLSGSASGAGAIRTANFTNAGAVYSQGAASITASSSFVQGNGGVISAASDLHFLTPAALKVEGKILAGGELDFGVFGQSGELNFLTLETGATVSARSLSRSGSRQFAGLALGTNALLTLNGDDARLDTGDRLTLAQGAALSMAGGGSATIRADSVDNAGQIAGKENLALDAVVDVTNRATGTLYAGQRLAVKASNVLNEAVPDKGARGVIAARQVVLEASNQIGNAGDIQAGDLGGRVASARLDNSGVIQSLGNLAIRAGESLSNAKTGAIAVLGDLSLATPGRQTLDGSVRSNGTLTLKSTADAALEQLTLGEGAILVAARIGGPVGALHLQKDAVVAVTGDNGLLDVTHELKVAAGAALSMSGQGDAVLNAGSVNNAGQISAANNLAIAVSEADLDNQTGGLIHAANRLRVTVGGQGDIANAMSGTMAGDRLELAANGGRLANSGALLAGSQGSRLTADRLINSTAGVMVLGSTETSRGEIDTREFSNSGQIQSTGSATIGATESFGNVPETGKWSIWVGQDLSLQLPSLSPTLNGAIHSGGRLDLKGRNANGVHALDNLTLAADAKLRGGSVDLALASLTLGNSAQFGSLGDFWLSTNALNMDASARLVGAQSGSGTMVVDLRSDNNELSYAHHGLIHSYDNLTFVTRRSIDIATDGAMSAAGRLGLIAGGSAMAVVANSMSGHSSEVEGALQSLQSGAYKEAGRTAFSVTRQDAYVRNSGSLVAGGDLVVFAANSVMNIGGSAPVGEMYSVGHMVLLGQEIYNSSLLTSESDMTLEGNTIVNSLPYTATRQTAYAETTANPANFGPAAPGNIVNPFDCCTDPYQSWRISRTFSYKDYFADKPSFKPQITAQGKLTLRGFSELRNYGGVISGYDIDIDVKDGNSRIINDPINLYSYSVAYSGIREELVEAYADRKVWDEFPGGAFYAEVSGYGTGKHRFRDVAGVYSAPSAVGVADSIGASISAGNVLKNIAGNPTVVNGSLPPAQTGNGKPVIRAEDAERANKAQKALAEVNAATILTNAASAARKSTQAESARATLAALPDYAKLASDAKAAAERASTPEAVEKPLTDANDAVKRAGDALRQARLILAEAKAALDELTALDAAADALVAKSGKLGTAEPGKTAVDTETKRLAAVKVQEDAKTMLDKAQAVSSAAETAAKAVAATRETLIASQSAAAGEAKKKAESDPGNVELAIQAAKAQFAADVSAMKKAAAVGAAQQATTVAAQAALAGRTAAKVVNEAGQALQSATTQAVSAADKLAQATSAAKTVDAASAAIAEANEVLKTAYAARSAAATAVVNATGVQKEAAALADVAAKATSATNYQAALAAARQALLGRYEVDAAKVADAAGKKTVADQLDASLVGAMASAGTAAATVAGESAKLKTADNAIRTAETTYAAALAAAEKSLGLAAAQKGLEQANVAKTDAEASIAKALTAKTQAENLLASSSDMLNAKQRRLEQFRVAIDTTPAALKAAEFEYENWGMQVAAAKKELKAASTEHDTAVKALPDAVDAYQSAKTKHDALVSKVNGESGVVAARQEADGAKAQRVAVASAQASADAAKLVVEKAAAVAATKYAEAITGAAQSAHSLAEAKVLLATQAAAAAKAALAAAAEAQKTAQSGKGSTTDAADKAAAAVAAADLARQMVSDAENAALAAVALDGKVAHARSVVKYYADLEAGRAAVAATEAARKAADGAAKAVSGYTQAKSAADIDAALQSQVDQGLSAARKTQGDAEQTLVTAVEVQTKRPVLGDKHVVKPLSVDIPPVNGLNFGGATITLPSNPNGRFLVSRTAEARYLVETNPLYLDFPSGANGINTDYLALRFGYDPNKLLMRLGDGGYEDFMIRQQVVAQTGRAVLQGYGNSHDMFAGLMNNAYNEGLDLGLAWGKAPSQGQLARLDKDIVWMVETVVQGRKVLAPVVYLAETTRQSIASGGVIEADKIDLQLASLTNNGGVVRGLSELKVVSTGDIVNRSGVIAGGNVSLKSMEGDIRNETLKFTEYKLDSKDGVNTFSINELAGKTALIAATGNLDMSAARGKIEAIGAEISAAGNAALEARTITFETLKLDGYQKSTGGSEKDGVRKEVDSFVETTRNAGSRLNIGGNLRSRSAGDTTIAGSTVVVGGSADIGAQGALNIINREDVSTRYGNSSEAGVGVNGGSGHGSNRSQFAEEAGKVVKSTVAIGGNAVLNGSKELLIQGSDIAIGGSARLTGERIAVRDAVDRLTRVETTISEASGKVVDSGTLKNKGKGDASAIGDTDRTSRTGSASGKATAEGEGSSTRTAGYAFYTREDASSSIDRATSVGSQIAIGGNALIGGLDDKGAPTTRSFTLQGSTVDVKGGAMVAADRIDILAGQNRERTTETKAVQQVGLFVTAKAEGQAKLGIEGDAQALTGQVGVGAKAEAAAKGGVSGGISFVEREDSTASRDALTHTAAELKSGGNLAIVARDLTAKGANIETGGDLDLKARNATFLTAKDESKSTSQTTKGSVGLFLDLSAKGKASAEARLTGSAALGKANAAAGADGSGEVSLDFMQVTTEKTTTTEVKNLATNLKAKGNAKLDVSEGDILAVGTNLAAGGDLEIRAKNASFLAAQDSADTLVERNATSAGLVGGVSGTAQAGAGLQSAGASAGAGTEAYFGVQVKNADEKTRSGSTTALVSTIKSGGNLTRIIDNQLTDQGTDIAAGGSVHQSARDIQSLAAKNTSYSAKATVDSEGKLLLTAGASAGAGVTQGGGSYDLSAGGRLEVKVEHKDESRNSSEAVVSKIKAGGNLTSVSTNSSVFEGTDIEAAGRVGIKGRNVTFAAARNTETVETSSNDVHASLAVTVNAETAIGGDVAVGYQRQSEKTVKGSAVAGSIKAGGGVYLAADDQLTLEGSTVKSDGGIVLDAGKVKVLAATDTLESNREGGGFEFAAGGSGRKKGGKSTGAGMVNIGANFNKGGDKETKESGASLDGQSVTIRSRGDTELVGTQITGTDGVAIDTGGDLQLKAAKTTRDSFNVGASFGAGGGGGSENDGTSKTKESREGQGALGLDIGVDQETRYQTVKINVSKPSGKTSISSGGKLTNERADLSGAGNLEKRAGQGEETVDLALRNERVGVSGAADISAKREFTKTKTPPTTPPVKPPPVKPPPVKPPPVKPPPVKPPPVKPPPGKGTP